MPATVVKSSITSTYVYDHTGQRVSINDGTTTRIYPNKLYDKAGTSTTKHIYANGELISTVDYNGTTTTVYHDHTDHLTGTGVITSSTPTEIQTLDYFPFGWVRLNDKAGSFDEKRQYAGSEFDTDTGLNYMNARYYSSGVGRFVSQDPVSRDNPGKFLLDPQQFNYYAYARNNPLRYIDPLGLYNTETGGIEKGDTEDSITQSINTTFNIKTNWETIKDVSFYNDRFWDKKLDQITWESLWIGTEITKDITNQLDKLNRNRWTLWAIFGKITLLNFIPNNIWDIKNSNDSTLWVGENWERSFWSYIYNGNLIRYDAPGNINYWYVARATGLTWLEIQSWAILEQMMDDGLKGREITFGDNSGDAKYIQMGINAYNRRVKK